MKRAFALLLLVFAVHGCSDTLRSILGSRVDDSAGVTYSGTITCAGAITDENGTTRFDGDMDVQRAIGASGLPIEYELEAAEGNKIEREIGGYVADVTISAVTSDAEGVVINASGYTEVQVCADETCSTLKYVSVEMIVTENYTTSDEGGVNLDSLFTIYIWDDGETTGSGSYACTGVLSPESE